MTSDKILQEKAKTLLDLHHKSEPLMLPNIWEPLGAAMLQELGYLAVATSSSAIALTNGLQDGENIAFNDLLPQLKRIAQSVSVPFSVDIEKGYASDDGRLSGNIEALLDAGIVGINIEDGDKKGGLQPIEEQCRRINMIRSVANRRGIHLVINARTDTFIYSGIFSGPDEQLEETIRRANAYRDAGADCFFPILARNGRAIQSITEQAGLPVNIMAMPGVPDFSSLRAWGVKRISLGGAFLKIAMRAMKRQALLLKDFKGQENIENNEVTSTYLEGLIGGNG